MKDYTTYRELVAVTGFNDWLAQRSFRVLDVTAMIQRALPEVELEQLKGIYPMVVRALLDARPLVNGTIFIDHVFADEFQVPIYVGNTAFSDLIQGTKYDYSDLTDVPYRATTTWHIAMTIVQTVCLEWWGAVVVDSSPASYFALAYEQTSSLGNLRIVPWTPGVGVTPELVFRRSSRRVFVDGVQAELNFSSEAKDELQRLIWMKKALYPNPRKLE